MTTDSPFGALAGLKVIDLSGGLGGPYCTQILGDHGAEIIKIEPPQGDEVRDWGPPFHDRGDDRDASYFIGVNRNKRSIVLDLEAAADRETFLELVASADFVLESGPGLDFAELERVNPRIVRVRLTPFGADGPAGGVAATGVATG